MHARGTQVTSAEVYLTKSQKPGISADCLQFKNFSLSTYFQLIKYKIKPICQFDVDKKETGTIKELCKKKTVFFQTCM